VNSSQLPTVVEVIGHFQLLTMYNLRDSDVTRRQFRRALNTYLFSWLRLQHLVTFCL